MKAFESTCNKLNKILENRPEKQDESSSKKTGIQKNRILTK